MEENSHRHNHSGKTLVEIHEDVPADHYDKGIKRNLFQKYWHSRRFSEIKKVLRQVDGPVLDVGCHSGTFTTFILNQIKTKEIYGVDISHSAIERIKKKIPYGHFQVADATILPFKDNFFDAVFCLEVLEHVDNPTEVIHEVRRVLKKDGYGVILVPTDNKLFRTVWFLWTMYYPVWRHAHVQSFSADSLETKLKLVGFKIEKVKTFNMGMLKLVVFKNP